MEKKEGRGSFSSSLGFVLAAAGSAVGLGNIWRFPNLAAKDGGGVFLLCYLILVLTFGFTLLTTEIAIGRKTGQSPLTAYGLLHKKMGWLGTLACIVPMVILPYYSVIGGWVLKYLQIFITGNSKATVDSMYFDNFIAEPVEPIVWFIIYLAATMLVIALGVGKGIERLSKYLMPALLVLIIAIAFFSLTLKHSDGTTTRTGIDGFLIYVIPNFKGMSFGKFCSIMMDAMGQLFYSVSVAMGIMITYGSYVKKDTNLVKSVNHIEIFDTAVAFLAGLMIIPAVYTFEGSKGLEAAGPGLMFKTLPTVFDSMGGIGVVVGIAFFLMVTFAALTSSVSIAEAIVSSFIDKFKMSRGKAVGLTGCIAGFVGLIVCLGYSKINISFMLPNSSSSGTILDLLDYLSNYVLMPVVAILTCILIGWIVKPRTVIDEVGRNGEKFHRKSLYIVMIKFVAPVMLVFLLLQSLGLF